MSQDKVLSERARDLRDMARLCQEEEADDRALQATLTMCDNWRAFSATLVAADRLTPEAENLIREGEKFCDHLARALLAATEAQKTEIEQMVRSLGLDQI